jgi:hypothetical protein
MLTCGASMEKFPTVETDERERFATDDDVAARK